MSIQFPKNVHVTLPSVDSWGTNMNILRDPPKGVWTRYKPKVGDTSEITQQIQDSGDRACEAIKVYARGVNPMVSVSYSNYGNNGGQVRYRAGSNGIDQSPITTSQAYSPYRVMREGAFRPPVIPPQELLPLSRLPRVFTHANTNAGSCQTTFAKRMECSADLKEIRKQLLQVCAAPKAIFNIERSKSQPIHLDNYVAPSCMATNVITNKGRVGGVLSSNPKPDRGIDKNKTYTTVSSKAHKNIQSQSLDGYCGNQPMPIKDTLKSCVDTNVSNAGGVNKYIHADKQLDRNLPQRSFTANRTNLQTDLNAHVNSHQYNNLPERTQRGSFSNSGLMPSFSRAHVPVEEQRSSLMQLAAKQQENRYRY
jgi:hypothetical protein